MTITWLTAARQGKVGQTVFRQGELRQRRKKSVLGAGTFYWGMGPFLGWCVCSQRNRVNSIQQLKNSGAHWPLVPTYTSYLPKPLLCMQPTSS